MNEGRIEKSPSRLNVERPLRSDYLNPIRGTRMLSIDKWSIKIEVGQRRHELKRAERCPPARRTRSAVPAEHEKCIHWI